MGKAQKITMIVSIVLVLALTFVLGIFLWKESRGDEATGGSTVTENHGAEDGETDNNGNGTTNPENPNGNGDGTISGDEPNPQEPEKPEPEITDVSLVFTGDVMLRDFHHNSYSSKGITGVISEYLRQEMTGADVTMINQEFPFSTRGTPMPKKTYTFRVNPSWLTMFHDMGVDVVSLANNHALDYGVDALRDTFATLNEGKVPYVGAGESREEAEKPVFLERGGRTIGVLGASRVIPVVEWNIENRQPGLFCTYDSTALKAAIERTKEQCDYLVVYVHWGVERTEKPQEYQRRLAQIYIDAGADLVVGSHPHVPQGIEYYNGKPIIYSLGNFIFNSNMKKTYMLKVIWDAAGESRLQVIPVGTTNALTRELTGHEALDMLDYIERISFDVSIDEKGIVASQ